jgi:hypothetical protein
MRLMREMSMGLGIVRLVVMFAVVCVLVWLALTVAVVALVIWVIYHLAVTERAATKSSNVAPVGFSVKQKSAGISESTNGIALLAAALAVAGATPFLLGHVSWYALGACVASAVTALVVLRGQAPHSDVTGYAMLGTLGLSIVLALITLFSLLMNAPVTLYGENWGENQGQYATIAEYQVELPCQSPPMSPASAEQGIYTVDLSGFVATSSCIVAYGDDARAAVFVQASSADELESIFGSGIIEVGRMDDGDVSVNRDGAIAVITSDEVSSELAEDTGTTFISLDDERP